MDKKLKIYIASPYTNGWQPDNVRRQLEAKHILMDHGFVPFAPLENHFGEIYKHRSEHDWFEWDLEWLEVCDMLVRIKGYHNGEEIKSTGADLEVKRAKELNIPVLVFNDLEELKAWASQK